MPCDMEDIQSLAEVGWNPEEIAQLEAEVELARANAGLIPAIRRAAELEARKVAHDRFHRKLQLMYDAIPKGDARQLVHAGHGPEQTLEALAMRAKLVDLGFIDG